MAEVYSLVCWGGKDGKTVTFTDTGDVVNLTNHGMRNGAGVVLSTTGSLPTGLTAGTTYYARQGADANKFTLHSSSADAIAGTGQVTFTGTGSGTHTCKGAYYVGLTDKSRWTTGGVERIYDGLVSWNTGRAGASAYDIEVCELAEAYDEIYTGSSLTVNIPAATVRITPTVNGTLSAAFHAGVVGAGFRFVNRSLIVGVYGAEVDGFTVYNSTVYGYKPTKLNVRATRLILQNYNASPTVNGVDDLFSGCTMENCLILGWSVGIQLMQYRDGRRVQNCTITKNGYGLRYQYDNATAQFGFFYNNIIIGNTTSNWPTTYTTIEGAANNAGASGNTIWDKVGSTAVTMATTDFLNYAGNDFSPAVVGSPQVDTGAAFYGLPSTDLAGDDRTSYENGATTYPDIGCLEFDHGYGPWPSDPVTVSTTVLADTRVVLYNETQDVEIENVMVTGTSYSYEITTEADADDILALHYFKEGYEEGVARIVWAGASAAFVATQYVHTAVAALRTELGITDYTTITEFYPDTTGHVYIEFDDPDGATMKARLAVWYNGILTTEGGARHFRGGIAVESTASFRVNTSVVNLLLENVNASQAVHFTDVQRRLYRDDGTTIIAPTSYSLHNDYSGVPDVVETGVSGLTGSESAQLMGLPSATATASQARTELAPELGRLDAAVSTRATVAGILAHPDALTLGTFLALK